MRSVKSAEVAAAFIETTSIAPESNREEIVGFTVIGKGRWSSHYAVASRRRDAKVVTNQKQKCRRRDIRFHVPFVTLAPHDYAGEPHDRNQSRRTARIHDARACVRRPEPRAR